MRDPSTDHDVLEDVRPKTRKPTLYKVTLLNDDYTTMEFVVQILESVFHKTPAEAYRIMMQVHTQGRGVWRLRLTQIFADGFESGDTSSWSSSVP